MKKLFAPFILLAAVTLSLAQAASGDGATVTDDLVAYFKGAYNPPTHNLGMRDGRYFPYQTPFGGRRIGYRSVIRDKALYRTGLSPEEAEKLLREDLSRTESDVRAHVKEKYPAKPFDKLSRESREILLDFAYSEGAAASVKDEVYRAVIDENWQSFINDKTYVRSKNGTPDYTLNRKFADQWIYSNKLIPAPPKQAGAK
jgi:hypothetical protein